MPAAFKIHGTLPGLNEYTAANRTHRHVGAKMKRDAEQQIAAFARSAKLPRFTEPVHVCFLWIEPDRRRDPDNVAFAKKFILDTLVTLKVLPGDGRKHVAGFTDCFMVDGTAPGVVVSIERAE